MRDNWKPVLSEDLSCHGGSVSVRAMFIRMWQASCHDRLDGPHHCTYGLCFTPLIGTGPLHDPGMVHSFATSWSSYTAKALPLTHSSQRELSVYD